MCPEPEWFVALILCLSHVFSLELTVEPDKLFIPLKDNMASIISALKYPCLFPHPGVPSLMPTAILSGSINYIVAYQMQLHCVQLLATHRFSKIAVKSMT